MKKYFALVLTIVMLLSLAACGGNKFLNDPHALETMDDFYDGGDIRLTADTAKTMLGIYTPEQLGLKAPIEDYELILSDTEYEGSKGCKIEAVAEGEKNAEGTFMIVEKQCYVFDVNENKYVLLSTGSSATQLEKTTSAADLIPDDPEITFQYHKENNYNMQQQFSQYEYTDLGLTKEVTSYVFIVTPNTGYALDGALIHYVDVYEKNGESTGVKVAFSADENHYVYDADLDIFVKLEK